MAKAVEINFLGFLETGSMTKPTKGVKTTFLSEDDLFDALTKSGFEFLRKSIEEFKTSTKFSTINFATAIELFLKAKLMREHWSLLLDKPDQASKQKFFSGDAKTATHSQSMDRLHTIASVNIPTNYQEIFKTIFTHRNKMVHFAHTGETGTKSSGGQNQIAQEQVSGWLALRTLLNEWPEFSSYKADIFRISHMMEGHRPYLQEVFESKKEELAEHKAKKLEVGTCPDCVFDAMKFEQPIGSIMIGSCVVCRNNETVIQIDCPSAECNEVVRFTRSSGAPGECPHCKIDISDDDIHDALNTNPVHKDNYFDNVEINCPQCSGYHTGVEHETTFVCLDCFDVQDKIEICGWCSEGQMGGVPENSHWSGCEFCDGLAGNMGDD